MRTETATSPLWVPSSARSDFKKAAPPTTGPAFGEWSGRDLVYYNLPGGAVMQFDLNRLTLQDYRMMTDHYQVNISLAVLAFALHQIDWRIECADKKIADRIESNIREIWTRLIRAVSQQYWAGYSPCALEYENTANGIEITKVKDLVPEECRVQWKYVDGYAPPNHAKPKFRVYDGIKQWGLSYPIPPENSLWATCMMQNGNFYGRKLLRPAFPSWFFSILMHLFANRYMERFGEPTPIGRYDEDATITDAKGNTVSGKQGIETVLMNLRNRGVVSLPSEKDEKGDYLFDLQYLESQMRGADFERYMTRLDEEISLALFVPLLLVRTADVGSYNLGTSHMAVYQWMFNALAGDLKEYIDRYVVDRLRVYNFGPNSPIATWEPRKGGKQDNEILRSVMNELTRTGQVMPDLDQLGQAVGLDLTKIKQLTAPPAPPSPDLPAGGGGGGGGGQ